MNMDTLRFCPQCQQPLPNHAPEGLCPQCLMKAAAAPPSEPQVVTKSGGGGVVDIGDPVAVGKCLPQFEILELLGRGGMGVVYKARQKQLDRLVALKILPPSEAQTADFVARFTREARSLAKLSHPNIVTVYDFGESGGLYYFIMESVDGANLRQMMQTKQLTAQQALAIVPKICDALQFAHEEGVMHRDIKPENILLDKKGRVKIADFGLAKLLRREQTDHTLTMSGMTLGTPRYMAPEQMDKPESVDHRADIYSLGVVFYEMLTGELPMGRFAPPSQKVQVDVRLDEIVLHALERDVERRYQHVSEIRTDVENVTGTPGAQASPPVRQAAVPAATAGAPPAANPEDDEDTEEAGEEHPFFAWAWKFVPLVAILLAFFNPWGGKAWYYFAAGCSVLAVSSGFFRTSTKAEAKETPPFRRESWWFSRSRGMQKFLGITIGAVLVLSLLAFFSFRMQVTTTADQSGVVRNLYNVTVGLGDPWLYLFRRLTGTRSGLESGMNIVAGSALFGFAALFAGTAVTRLTREQKRRGKLADASGDAPQRAFFWHAIAGGVFFIAGAVGAVVHAQRSEANGGILADAVHEVHPDFARPGSTSIALKKAIADELKLTPDQLEKINQSLNRHYLEFLKLENDHSSYRVENGHVVKTIQPFPDRSFALAQRLANELRAVAGQEIVPAPERGAVWKLRLFRHAGEFNVRAELWEKDGKYHREESWEREGRRIMGGKSGDTLTDMNLAFGTYATDWAAMQTNIHEPKPDDAHHSWVFGWDTMQFFINQTRQAELARMLATDPKAVIQSGNPHVALVTQAGTPLGRACVETQLRNFGIAFRKDTTPDDLVGKLETLLGSDISAPTPPATERQ